MIAGEAPPLLEDEKEPPVPAELLAAPSPPEAFVRGIAVPAVHVVGALFPNSIPRFGSPLQQIKSAAAVLPL
jgi:hypothetical protein